MASGYCLPAAHTHGACVRRGNSCTQIVGSCTTCVSFVCFPSCAFLQGSRSSLCLPHIILLCIGFCIGLGRSSLHQDHLHYCLALLVWTFLDYYFLVLGALRQPDNTPTRGNISKPITSLAVPLCKNHIPITDHASQSAASYYWEACFHASTSSYPEMKAATSTLRVSVPCPCELLDAMSRIRSGADDNPKTISATEVHRHA
ncbi:hypothetical protein EJ05DRAFT_385507 [Pseudovirgaria hyperparasitica]|uniref:Uncharacterized protein n=1 Tax=Pseudovirgaria hyperparasitica TaxID=470096 RepID=A0A6A6W546_9PEZI|nr:uncharacterized protein EJ05DRAFT_385507 [Pseudovirgaria hyperparasitica]KAF2757299.1 hypothetical protein EJ05DRAFT_385507 [Pseudovirgaria hyperparasitica]